MENLCCTVAEEGMPNKNFFTDSFQEKIWKDKYQYNGETFQEFCCRIAKNIFPNELLYQDQLMDNLLKFEMLFGGRINANIGVEEAGLTLFNCYICPTSDKNIDSLESILDLAKRYALTLKSEGGVGFCASFLRPANTIIRKVGVTTPGSIKFLEIFDKISEVITSGSVDKDTSMQGIPTKNSIRKGATMVTMHICHPDIEAFITAKATPNRLTKMNMSVLVTDDFMKALSEDADWALWFPDIGFDRYDSEWDGDFHNWTKKNYPRVIYNTVRASYLWDLLMKSSYNRNEPGILFIDNARRMDNLWYLPESNMNSCNPCGEIMGNVGVVEYEGERLLLGDVCNLGSINITKFYNLKTHEFNMDKFLNCVALMVRSLDSVCDISAYPLPIYGDAAKLKRKIGVGITGIGSIAMMMNIRYGSELHLSFLEDLIIKCINAAYQASALLSKEKGPFPLYNPILLDGGFVKHSGVLTDDTIMLIKKYGLRNAAVMAIAPNGTLSILAGNVSSGIEPVFSKEFFRWNRVEGKKVGFKYPNVHKGEWFETDYFKETVVNDEPVLVSTDDLYRIDKNTGLCAKIIIKDYGYQIAESLGFTETQGAMELSIDAHLKVLGIFGKGIDQSTSKTINVPNDTSFEEFKQLYSKIYTYGIKGCTTYREGTSVAVLESSKKEHQKTVQQQQEDFLDAFKNQNGSIVVEQNVSLPEEYPSKGYVLRSEGKKWYLHVAFKDKSKTKPFAIFVNTNAREDNVPTFNAIDKLETLAIFKGLKQELIDEAKQKYAYQKNPVKICRMLGLLLRHNISVYDIVMTLNEVEEATIGTFVVRIKKFLSQFITEINAPDICPSCGERSLVFQESCYFCRECFYSACG